MATCHAQELLNHMFGNPEHSDLVIVLPHKGIYLHKSVLFSACPAMAARSKKAGNKSFLILLEDATIMESILHYVYGAQIPMIFDVEQCQRAIKLLLAAKKYKMGKMMTDINQAIALYITKHLKSDVEGQVELGIWLYELKLQHPVVETMQELVLKMIAENMMVLTSRAHEDKFAAVWAKLLGSGELIKDVMYHVARHSRVVAYLPSHCGSRKRADSGVEI